MLTSAKFNEARAENRPNGVFKCNRSNCDICKYYLQEGNTVTLENDITWEIRSHITCQSKNALYFQRCNFCTNVSNIGKTNILRSRTNNHISLCKSGKGTDVFDRHVYHCNKDPNKSGPHFKLWVLMELSDFSKLITYENYLHRIGGDTINRGKPE